MRIAQVMLAKNFGGAERSFVDMANALTERGHEVLAICERRAAAKTMLKAGAIETITVHGPWDPFAKRKIARLLKRYESEIVHAHLARAAKFAGAAARECALPSLVKTHNYVDLKYYQSVDRLVPTTGKQFDYLIAAGISRTRITQIPNFTSMPLTGKVHQFDNNDEIRLIAVGRLVHKKGFDVLLEAIEPLSDAYPLRLAIVGDGPERQSLQQQIDRLGLTDVVQLCGWRQDVRIMLDDSDVFILPSRDEPFGIVCLEAMAAGIPIVATRTDGPNEFLDAETAELVAIDDSAALRAGINRVIDDPVLATQRARSALEHCRGRYTRDVVVDRYLELYAELLDPG